MINRNFFFDQANLRLFDGKLPAKTRAALGQILDYWESNAPNEDHRWLAYALGTAHHETDRTFGPIRKYGRGKGKKYSPYYGRGLVQLTWDYNYKKMSSVWASTSSRTRTAPWISGTLSPSCSSV
jgi:putative chitinase